METALTVIALPQCTDQDDDSANQLVLNVYFVVCLPVITLTFSFSFFSFCELFCLIRLHIPHQCSYNSLNIFPQVHFHTSNAQTHWESTFLKIFSFFFVNQSSVQSDQDLPFRGKQQRKTEAKMKIIKGEG